jgi:dihydroorotase
MGLEQGILPDAISSDLQNRNVTGPAKSLCHVMSIFLNLGMSLSDVIERVTIRPALALGAELWRGRIMVGGQADITLLSIEEGDYRFRDCDGQEIAGHRRFVPVKVWKAGKEIDCRPEAVEEFENWMVEKNEECPARLQLDAADHEFLRLLNKRLRKIPWGLEKIHEVVHLAVEDSAIELRRAISLVQSLCLKKPFPQSMATLLKDLGQERAGKYIDFLSAA